jgi:hypothetical protein
VIAALLLTFALQGEGTRLWWLELELAGPCAEFTLDCGAEGATRVRGPFLAGEGRRLRVPVPVRSPLGAEGLALLTLPQVRGVEAREIGWSAEQPDAELVRAARALLARARPPAGGAVVVAGRAEVLLVAFLLPVLLVLRRRTLVLSLVALAGGTFVFLRTRAATAQTSAVELREFDLAAGEALRVRSALDELELPTTRLEVLPEGTALAFDFAPDVRSGTVRARGATLCALERFTTPAELGSALDSEGFVESWVRAPSGAWTAHGAWPAGGPPPPARAGLASPPGWLVGALPPGVGLLVGRTDAGVWVRASGFELPGQESGDGY